ncbi:MAG: cyclic nucleotide-binding domain-containing protein [Actinobacteria bacterium]|nr:MAG: cyclic nucleotide-binding domain-containing protein [Actinomycetota bacterium]
MERVFRTVTTDLTGTEVVVLDGKRVHSVDETAIRLLSDLAGALDHAARVLLLAQFDVGPSECLSTTPALHFADVDAALEWCEDRLLLPMSESCAPDGSELTDQPLLHGLSPVEAAAVAELVTLQKFAAGEMVFREGDPADALFFLLEGTVSVRLALGDQVRSRRLATLGPGCSFGEMALLDEGARSADLVADEPSVVASLSTTALATLAADHPALISTIYRNLAQDLSRRLRATNAQVRALEQ